MGTRRQARETALQMLYLMDACRLSREDATAAIWGEKRTPQKTYDFSAHLVEGIERECKPIDALLVKYAENWELARMAAIDRNIMRLASFELLHELETPVSVIINEAVEIAKKYSTPDSGKFVNGILDKIKNERPHEIKSR